MIKRFSFLNSAIFMMAMLVLLFLYLPLIVVTIYSFNPDSVNSFPMSGFSLKWYQVMANNEALIQSLKNSVIVALISTFFAICLGLPGAFLVDRFNFPGKKLFERIVLLPLMLPGILTGVALLNFFQEIGIRSSMTAVIIGHTTFLIAVIMTQVYARLKRLDKNLEQASYDLGATKIQTFFYIILPSISTSLIGASMLAFTLSLDEIPVTFFLNGVFSTLPLQIWGMTRNGITPEVNAISTIVFFVSLVLIIISTTITKEEGRRV